MAVFGASGGGSGPLQKVQSHRPLHLHALLHSLDECHREYSRWAKTRGYIQWWECEVLVMAVMEIELPEGKTSSLHHIFSYLDDSLSVIYVFYGFH